MVFQTVTFSTLKSHWVEAISKLPLAEAKPTEGGFSYPPFELRFGGLENPPSVKF
jgi:hypothetical protein